MQKLQAGTVLNTELKYSLKIVASQYVTRPAKTGHVGTNYILSHYRSYLSTGTEYLYSVTYIIQPIKILLDAQNCIAIA